jgi:hypothetical protein
MAKNRTVFLLDVAGVMPAHAGVPIAEGGRHL